MTLTYREDSSSAPQNAQTVAKIKILRNQTHFPYRMTPPPVFVILETTLSVAPLIAAELVSSFSRLYDFLSGSQLGQPEHMA